MVALVIFRIIPEFRRAVSLPFKSFLTADSDNLNADYYLKRLLRQWQLNFTV